MSERTEWPTTERIAELRQKGIVSYSKRSGACMVVVACMLLAMSVSDFTKMTSTFFTLPIEALDVALITKQLQHVLLQGILIPIAAVLSVLCLWGLFQTKFLFKLGLVNVSFARLLPSAREPQPSFVSRIASLVTSFLIAAICSCLLVQVVGVQIFRLIQDSSPTNIYSQFHELKSLLPLISLTAILSALLFLLVEKLRFAFIHRMTRKEVLAERHD